MCRADAPMHLHGAACQSVSGFLKGYRLPGAALEHAVTQRRINSPRWARTHRRRPKVATQRRAFSIARSVWAARCRARAPRPMEPVRGPGFVREAANACQTRAAHRAVFPAHGPAAHRWASRRRSPTSLSTQDAVGSRWPRCLRKVPHAMPGRRRCVLRWAPNPALSGRPPHQGGTVRTTFLLGCRGVLTWSADTALMRRG